MYLCCVHLTRFTLSALLRTLLRRNSDPSMRAYSPTPSAPTPCPCRHARPDARDVRLRRTQEQQQRKRKARELVGMSAGWVASFSRLSPLPPSGTSRRCSTESLPSLCPFCFCRTASAPVRAPTLFLCFSSLAFLTHSYVAAQSISPHCLRCLFSPAQRSPPSPPSFFLLPLVSVYGYDYY